MVALWIAGQACNDREEKTCSPMDTGASSYYFYSTTTNFGGAGSSQNGGQTGFQVLGRQALEARAGKALQPPDDERHDHRSAKLTAS